MHNPTTATSRPLAAIPLLWAASLAVLLVCLLAAFRRGFADDLATALLVNGPRVTFGAAVGAALALCGGLRLAGGRGQPLDEVKILAFSAAASGGGFLLATHASAATALWWFASGAAAAALLAVQIVRWLDRPQRWTNLALAPLLAALATIATLAGTYARERRDMVAPVVSWLLGDLGGSTFSSAAAVFLVTLLLAAWAMREGTRRREPMATLAFGLAVGAAGPLAFVGTLAPRTVRWLAAGAAPQAVLLTGMAAGAATVVAVDSVPRLLLGGYDFPWNLPATMLALPIFLGWNRTRLRREVGRAHWLFEAVELLTIAGLTIAAIALAVVLTRVIQAAT